MNDIILQVPKKPYINHTKKIVKNSFLKTIQIVQIQMYSDRNMKVEYALEIFKFKYHDLSIISYCDAPTYLV